MTDEVDPIHDDTLPESPAGKSDVELECVAKNRKEAQIYREHAGPERITADVSQDDKDITDRKMPKKRKVKRKNPSPTITDEKELEKRGKHCSYSNVKTAKCVCG
jgi:hypothetical protein